MDKDLLHSFIEWGWEEFLAQKGVGLQFDKPTADISNFMGDEEGEVVEEAPAGPKVVGDTRAVRGPATGDKVYVINDKEMTKRWVTSPQVLEGLGFSLTDVVEIPDMELAKYKPSSAVMNVPKT